MSLATHRHSPNGIGARDENGLMVCWCGIPYDDHAAAMAAPDDKPIVLIGVGPDKNPPVMTKDREFAVRVGMLHAIVAADGMASALRSYLASGTTGDRERAQVALDLYDEARRT